MSAGVLALRSPAVGEGIPQVEGWDAATCHHWSRKHHYSRLNYFQSFGEKTLIAQLLCTEGWGGILTEISAGRHQAGSRRPRFKPHLLPVSTPLLLSHLPETTVLGDQSQVNKQIHLGTQSALYSEWTVCLPPTVMMPIQQAALSQERSEMDSTHLLAQLLKQLWAWPIHSVPSISCPRSYVSAKSNCVLTFPVPICLLLWSKK